MGMDTCKVVTKNLCEDDITDRIHCDNEVPVACKIDKETVSIVMKPTQDDSDESDSE